MDLAGANLLVDARPILAGRLWGSHRATNGKYLLCCCDGPARFRLFGETRTGNGKIGIKQREVNAASPKGRCFAADRCNSIKRPAARPRRKARASRARSRSHRTRSEERRVGKEG